MSSTPPRGRLRIQQEKAGGTFQPRRQWKITPEGGIINPSGVVKIEGFLRVGRHYKEVAHYVPLSRTPKLEDGAADDVVANVEGEADTDTDTDTDEDTEEEADEETEADDGAEADDETEVDDEAETDEESETEEEAETGTDIDGEADKEAEAEAVEMEASLPILSPEEEVVSVIIDDGQMTPPLSSDLGREEL